MLEYRIAKCDIDLPRDRKKVLVKYPPVDVRGDGFLWWRYKVEEVGEEVAVLAGGIKSSNFHFLSPLSHMLLKIFS